MVDKLIYTIRVFITVVILLIWSVIGLMFWIPLMIRMVAYFCGMITISTFQNVDIKYAQDRLNFSIEFYVMGFIKILDILKRKKFGEIKLETNQPINFKRLLFSIIWDIIWTISFWGGIIILLIN